MTDQDKTDLDRRAAEVLGIYVVCDQFGRPWACVGDVVSLWHPTESRDQAAWLEQEVARRGLQEGYVFQLSMICPIAMRFAGKKPTAEYLFWLATAPPEARVRAALAVLEPKPQTPDGQE